MRYLITAAFVFVLLGCSTVANGPIEGKLPVEPQNQPQHPVSEADMAAFLYDMAQLNEELAHHISSEVKRRQHECATFALMPLVNHVRQTLPPGWC